MSQNMTAVGVEPSSSQLELGRAVRKPSSSRQALRLSDGIMGELQWTSLFLWGGKLYYLIRYLFTYFVFKQ